MQHCFFSSNLNDTAMSRSILPTATSSPAMTKTKQVTHLVGKAAKQKNKKLFIVFLSKLEINFPPEVSMGTFGANSGKRLTHGGAC